MKLVLDESSKQIVDLFLQIAYECIEIQTLN